MARKNKQDWLNAGLTSLGYAGMDNLTIDGLAAQLEVTKGSFYHHFKHASDFQEQLVAYWASQYFSTVDDLPETPAASLALLDLIMQEGFGPITTPEPAIRVWAHQDVYAQGVVGKVDAARRQFVFKIFLQLTEDENKARLMADLLYTVLIGSIMAQPPLEMDRLNELYRELKHAFGITPV